MTHTIHRDCILIQARLPTLWGREIVNVSGLSLRLSPTWAARRSLLKGKTGRTLLSCLTHSVTVDPWTRLRRYFTTLCILEFLFSAWLSPFNTSLLDVDWFSFDNVLRLRSSKWLRLPIAYPNFSGVELKWKKKRRCLRFRWEWTTFFPCNGDEKLSPWKTSLQISEILLYRSFIWEHNTVDNPSRNWSTFSRFHTWTLEFLNLTFISLLWICIRMASFPD